MIKPNRIMEITKECIKRLDFVLHQDECYCRDFEDRDNAMVHGVGVDMKNEVIYIYGEATCETLIIPFTLRDLRKAFDMFSGIKPNNNQPTDQGPKEEKVCNSGFYEDDKPTEWKVGDLAILTHLIDEGKEVKEVVKVCHIYSKEEIEVEFPRNESNLITHAKDLVKIDWTYTSETDVYERDLEIEEFENTIKDLEEKLTANEKIMDEAGEDMARLDEHIEGLKMENKKLILMLKLATKDHKVTEDRLQIHADQINELIYAVKDLKEELIESGNIFEYKKGDMVAWNGEPTTILKTGDKGMYTGLDNRGCHYFIFRVDGDESHIHYSPSYWMKNRLNITPATQD